jgi:hypothetical protein
MVITVMVIVVKIIINVSDSSGKDEEKRPEKQLQKLRKHYKTN